MFTRTPAGLNSAAQERLSAVRAAFVAPDRPPPGRAGRGPGALETGYGALRDYGRRGLATAAAAALTSAAFTLPGIDWVEIVHDELNRQSEAVPRKLGFTRVGQRMLDFPPEAGTGLGIVWRLDRPAATPSAATAGRQRSPG